MKRAAVWLVVGLAAIAVAGPTAVTVLDRLVWPVVAIGLVIGVLRAVWFLTRR